MAPFLEPKGRAEEESPVRHAYRYLNNRRDVSGEFVGVADVLARAIRRFRYLIAFKHSGRFFCSE